MSASTPRSELVDPQAAFDELGRTVLAETSMPDLLTRVAELATLVIAGASQASISVLSRDRATTVTSTGPVATALDETQYAAGFGPCLAAAAGGQVTAVPDTAAETRWPDFARRAREHGIGATLSLPIPLQQGTTAALNLYAELPGGFDETARATAVSFAAYAGVALANVQQYGSVKALAEQLQEAMDSRAVIEQAKGVLMGQRRCTADDAFDLLVSLSQRSNRKLRDVARAVVDSSQP